jgi:GNAT superfamily N-acetyltransferase
MEIRLATETDFETVTDCVQAAFSVWTEIIGCRPFALDTDYTGRIEQGYVYLAIENDELFGIIALWPDGNTVYVDTVAVYPNLQGRGVGRVLLDFAESHARTLGKVAISLCTNEKMDTNRAYYQKLGYSEIRHEVHPDGRGVIWLKKPLDSLNPPA